MSIQAPNMTPKMCARLPLFLEKIIDMMNFGREVTKTNKACLPGSFETVPRVAT